MVRAWFPMTRGLASFQGKDESASVLKGGVLVSIIRFGGVGLAYGTQVFLTRWMGGSEMGVYVYALAWASVLALVAAIGLPYAGLRFIPQYVASGDQARLLGFMRNACLLTLASSLAVAGLVLVVVFYIWPTASDYRTPILIAVAAIPLLAATKLLSQMNRAFKAVVAAAVPMNIVRPILILAGSALIVFSGQKLTAISALWVTLFGIFIVGCIQVLLLERVKRTSLSPLSREPVYETRQWLQVSLPLLMVVGSNMILTHSDILMIGAYLTSEDVAIYNAAAKTAAFVSFGLVALNARGTPAIAGLFAQGKHTELQSLVTNVALWALVPAAVLTLGAVVFGDLALGIFGSSFTAAHSALIILGFGHLINAAAGPVASLLTTTGHQNVCGAILAASALTNIGLNFLLIPLYGINGAAMATASTMAIWNLALWPIVMKRLKVRPLGVSRIPSWLAR